MNGRRWLHAEGRVLLVAIARVAQLLDGLQGAAAKRRRGEFQVGPLLRPVAGTPCIKALWKMPLI